MVTTGEENSRKRWRFKSSTENQRTGNLRPHEPGCSCTMLTRLTCARAAPRLPNCEAKRSTHGNEAGNGENSRGSCGMVLRGLERVRLSREESQGVSRSGISGAVL